MWKEKKNIIIIMYNKREREKNGNQMRKIDFKIHSVDLYLEKYDIKQ